MKQILLDTARAWQTWVIVGFIVLAGWMATLGAMTMLKSSYERSMSESGMRTIKAISDRQDMIMRRQQIILNSLDKFLDEQETGDSKISGIHKVIRDAKKHFEALPDAP